MNTSLLLHCIWSFIREITISSTKFGVVHHSPLSLLVDLMALVRFRANYLKTWSSISSIRLSRCLSSPSDVDPIQFSTPAISNYRKKLTTTTDFEIPLSLQNSSSSPVTSPATISSPQPLENNKKQIPEIQFSVPIIKNKYHQETGNSGEEQKMNSIDNPSNQEGNTLKSSPTTKSKDVSPPGENGALQSNSSGSNDEEDTNNDFKFNSSHVMSGIVGFLVGILTSYMLIKHQIVEIDTGVVLLEEPENKTHSSFQTPEWLQLPKKK